jgi:hypothetical protein
MSRGKTTVNFTTIRGKAAKKKAVSTDYLEARAERWINDKLEEGWSLRDVLPAGEEAVHIVMIRKEQAPQ